MEEGEMEILHFGQPSLKMFVDTCFFVLSQGEVTPHPQVPAAPTASRNPLSSGEEQLMFPPLPEHQSLKRLSSDLADDEGLPADQLRLIIIPPPSSQLLNHSF